MLLVSTIRLEVQEQLYSCPGGRQMFSPKKSVNLLRWKKVVFLANQVMTMRYNSLPKTIRGNPPVEYFPTFKLVRA